MSAENECAVCHLDVTGWDFCTSTDPRCALPQPVRPPNTGSAASLGWGDWNRDA